MLTAKLHAHQAVAHQHHIYWSVGQSNLSQCYACIGIAPAGHIRTAADALWGICRTAILQLL